jgi:hypothetical protein
MTRAARTQSRNDWRSILSAPLVHLRAANVFVQIAAAVAVIGITVAFSMKLWQQVQPHVSTRPEYLTPPESIEITAAPEWIHTNIKTEVIRDSGLKEPLSILDERLSTRLTQAFSLHPWVGRVAAVNATYPARIQVDLEYRRPAAMVEVQGGLLPIDVDGVLLPTEDFSPQDAQNYPRIAGIVSGPLGPLGTRWGDPALEAAGKLAPVLQPVWKEFQLHHIQLQPQMTQGQKFVLEMVTNERTVFMWGSPPGNEQADERSASEKLARLTILKTQHGALNSVPVAARDLRRFASSN